MITYAIPILSEKEWLTEEGTTPSDFIVPIICR
jgi:hypothetical protein